MHVNFILFVVALLKTANFKFYVVFTLDRQHVCDSFGVTGIRGDGDLLPLGGPFLVYLQRQKKEILTLKELYIKSCRWS